jgi:ABC-type ATPase involved in cell division
MSEEKIIVELNNVFLRSSRGYEVFRDLNFKLLAGHSAIIQGTAGSGKSSFIEMLIGRQFCESGSVEVFGNLITARKKGSIKRNRRKIGGVGGIFSLVPSYTVTDNISLPLILSGAKSKYRSERISELLTEFSLLKQAKEYPANLTRVENMLVQFARASIAHQPLLIIDEPMAGFDQNTYSRIYDYMFKLAVSGLSLIIVSSEEIENKLPNCQSYRIDNGTLV